MEFLSFNELKFKLSNLYKRNVDNVEIINIIMENEVPLIALANGFYVGEYVKSAEKIAIKKIHRDVRYVELFDSNKLTRLMSNDLEKLSTSFCKSLFGKEIECDGFIFLPKDICERLIFRLPDREALSFPCWLSDLEPYYDQSEILLEITCNSLYLTKSALSSILDKTEILTNENVDDCAELKGIHKTNRDARDRRGMARILAKYIDGNMEDKNYKLKDVAEHVIKLMKLYEVEPPKVEQIKKSIRWVVDPCARSAGVNKTKV